jgi:4-hydroxy-tetrahydrodipicolinate synthase
VDGIVAHYRALARETERTIIVYNIPYRTGVNLPNDALLEIAATVPNVRAVKDSTGDISQSLDLLQRAPDDFAVLTGEDHLFFTSLANGGAGGILAAAHLATKTFVDVADAMAKEELTRARTAWRRISPMTSTLFSEPNPMPLKYVLWRLGLLRSPECRLPLTRVSDRLAATLDDVAARLAVD